MSVDLYYDLDKCNFITVNGVLIKPRKLFLRNSYEGKSFREKITLQNTSCNPVTISTVFPHSLYFSVDRNIYAEQLCAGLTTTIWVSYTHKQNAAMLAYLAVYINNEKIDIFIEVVQPKAVIYCEPRNLYFGQININTAVHVQKLRLYNRGTRQSKFEFDIANNNLGLTIIPKKGYIQGEDSIEIEVELIGFEEGVFNKEIWVKSEKPTRFSLFVDVIKPKLFICSPHEYTENFLPIMFPPTHAGCRVVHNFEVFNLNMQNTTFIIVPEFNFQAMAAHKVEELDPSFKMFHFNPIEGNLEPNGKKKIEISFKSQSKKLINDQVYFVCFRLIRLSVQTVDKIINEQKIQEQKLAARLQTRSNFFGGLKGSIGGTMSQRTYSSFSSGGSVGDVLSLVSPDDRVQKKTFGEFIRICIYAVVKSLKIEVDPIQFTLHEMLIDTELETDLTIYNKSRKLPVMFEYEKVGYIRIVPTKGWIKKSSSAKVKIIFAPKAAGIIDKPIKFNFLYYSQPQDAEKELVKIGSVLVPVHIPIKLKQVGDNPKFNMGITPKITNEVGFMTDDIRFNSKVKMPKAAVLQSIKSPVKKLDNALVAFPNDRPKVLQPWRNEVVKCKTIFAGLSRTIAPPDKYMLSNDELLRKLKNDKYYLEYIDELRKIRLSHETKVPWEDYLENENKVLHKVSYVSCPKHWEKETNLGSNFGKLKPIQIHFVSITPTKIKIAEVAVDSEVTYTIDIFNENKFAVSVLLTCFPHHRSVFPNLPDRRIVNSNEKVTMKHRFRALGSGSFSSILNVYLNNVHLVPILLQAEVAEPSVSVDNDTIIFDDKDPSHTRILPLKNVLNIPVSFNWTIPNNSCYQVQPMKGTVPPHRSILCEILYTPDFMKRKCVKLSVHSTGTSSRCPVNIHLDTCYTNCYMEFIERKVEILDIPINIPTYRTVYLRNYGQEMALFRIKNTAPCSGISVTPETGIVKGRCYAEIVVRFFFQAFYAFSYKIEVEFQYEQKVHFLVIGQVAVPNITFIPNKIEMKRMPAQSFEIVPFLIENTGSSLVGLNFPKNFYPELTISGSNNEDISLAENIELILEKGETAQLYLHYYPLDVGMSQIYLPVVLNNILGPAEKLEEDSTFIHQYVKTGTFSVATLEDHIEMVNYRKREIAVMNLTTVSTKHILRFSKLYFKFKYIPTVPHRAITSIEVKVKNCVKTVVEFCLDISKMSRNVFDLVCKTPESIVHRDEEVICFLLEEEEEITLTAQYIPTIAGNHVCNIPIYIKNVKDGRVFNYFRFSVLHPIPTFKCPRWVFLEPVPLDVTIVYDFRLYLYHHHLSCSLNADCEGELFSVQIIPSEQETLIENITVLKISFKSSVVINECAKLNIGCTCGVYFFVIVGVCAADDVLTSYGYYCPTVAKEQVLKSRGYPYFPENASEYTTYMNKCVDVVERWIYEQTLNKTFYYHISNDMSGYCRTGKKPKSKVLVIIQIIQNLTGCGEDILTVPYEETGDNVCRVNALYYTLKNVLLFLKKQGAKMPHIRARYLLPYSDYLVFMKKVRPEINMNSEELKQQHLFEQRSKQSWLDLMLQIYKLLVFSRIPVKGKSRSGRLSGGTSDSNFSNLPRDSTSSWYVGLGQEKVLFTWLRGVYKEESDSLLKLDKDLPKNFVLPPREITNFTNHLSDSIVFIAVTKHYCPYLTSYLEDIYVNVDAEEKAYHNAITLIEAWKLINVSFTISPSEIVKPIPLQMLMLVVYMYDFFPNYTPKDDLYFNVGLSKTKTHEIVIKNVNTVELNYEIRFIHNELQCFKALTQSNFIKIYPGKTYKLKIEFKAKYLETIKAAIILCGDVPGQQYSKSMSYMLYGIPNFMDDHQIFVFEIDLYKSKEFEFVITSPYPEAARYDIWCTRDAPNELNSEKLIPVKDYLYIIRPRTIYHKQYTLQTDEEGNGQMNITICCLSTNQFDSTMMFLNQEVGDFFCSIKVKPVNFDHFEKYVIPIELPAGFDNIECNCCDHNKLKSLKNCPRKIVLKIPCRNDQFWSVITHSVMQCVPHREKCVWEKFLEAEMGPHLLRWLLFGSVEQKTVEHLFAYEVKYVVNNVLSEVTLPNIVIMSNVRSEHFVEVEMHAKGDISRINNFDFSLQSEDGIEFRWYTVEFVRKYRETTRSSLGQCMPKQTSLHSYM